MISYASVLFIVMGLLLIGLLCVLFYMLHSKRYLAGDDAFEEDFRADEEVPQLTLPDTAEFDDLIADFKADVAAQTVPKFGSKRHTRRSDCKAS